MFNDQTLDRLLSELIKQWNIAEKRIKKAEQVRGNEVVASAIFELRYAGRKLIDALTIAHSTDLKSDRAAYERVQAYLADAVEDCVKAKHDAIDAMMTFVTSWFRTVEGSLGLDKLQQFFPDYLQTVGMIAGVQRQVTESRGNRTILRDLTYDELDKDGGEYDQILSLFDRMQQSNKRVEAVVRRERLGKLFLWFITIVSLLVAVWGVFGF